MVISTSLLCMAKSNMATTMLLYFDYYYYYYYLLYYYYYIYLFLFFLHLAETTEYTDKAKQVMLVIYKPWDFTVTIVSGTVSLLCGAFCDKIQKFSRNFANFSRKIAALHCVVSGLAKKYEPAILVCKETAENGE